MVLIVTSHFEALGDNFFHQHGLLKIYQDTRYGMDGFLISNLKFNYMRKFKIKKFKLPFNLIGDKRKRDIHSDMVQTMSITKFPRC